MRRAARHPPQSQIFPAAEPRCTPPSSAGDLKSEIEKLGVATGSAAETDTPGRALHTSTGKCCKRAAKCKRKKISYKHSASDCEKSLEESKAKEMPTCDYASGEVFDGSSCIKAVSNEDETTEPADNETTEPADNYALVRSGTCEQAGRSVVLDGTCGTTCNGGVCHTQGMALGWDIGWTNQVYSLTSWSAWGSRPPTVG